MKLLGSARFLRDQISKLRARWAMWDMSYRWYGALSLLHSGAQAVSLDAVESLFRESRLARRIARAYVRYLKDAEAERALKKGYHMAYEDRMRILALGADPPWGHGSRFKMPPVKSHPLDPHALGDLGGLDGQSGSFLEDLSRSNVRSLRWYWFLALEAGLRFLLEVSRGFIRGGGKSVPVRCRVATPNFYPEERWVRLRQALEELGQWTPDHLLIVMERKDNQSLRGGSFRTVDPTQFLVPRRLWFSRVLLPSVHLTGLLLCLSMLALRDARCLELVLECFRQARYSLDVWRIAFNISFDSYLDNAEYDARHNVKAIIFRKFGGRLVRWPHSQMDSPSSSLSYLGYDDFLSGGSYQVETYGGSWNPRLRSVSVGLVQHDRRMLASERVDAELAKRVETYIGENRRLAVFFGSSVIDRPSVIDAYRDWTLEALWRMRAALRERDGWVILLKPKGSHQRFYNWMRTDPRLSGWTDDDRVIAVRYGTSAIELCPVGWLIDRMAFGVCLGGSVAVEGLVRRIPIFCLRPVWQETPYVRKLRECGLLHDDAESFEAALRRYIDAPHSFDIPHDWFREHFDPFGDDQALLRVAGYLFGHDGGFHLRTGMQGVPGAGVVEAGDDCHGHKPVLDSQTQRPYRNNRAR